MVAARYAERHRHKARSALRHCARMLAIAVAILCVTVLPTLLGWWSLAWPAAVGTAIAALVVLSVAVMLPLELIATVDMHFDRTLERAAFPGLWFALRFGRRLYTESARLDALAAEAGLPPLSSFESHDVIETGEPPRWFQPAEALPTLRHLLASVEPGSRLQGELAYVQETLQIAVEAGARFYFLVHTRAGFTNAEIHARRSGLSGAE
jgi:hypothetical protein